MSDIEIIMLIHTIILIVGIIGLGLSFWYNMNN
jgi:hypothetical protein